MFINGELQKQRMLRRCVCATAVPIFPGEAPITPDGLQEKEFLPYGRLPQSIAFLSPPGIELLELSGDRGEVPVVVIAVQRKVTEGDLVQLEF